MRFHFPAACVLFLIFVSSGLADDAPSGITPVANSAAAAPEIEQTAGLRVIDWLIIAVYGCGTIGLGWYYGRSQKSTH